MDAWALRPLAATNWWLWAGDVKGICHLPLTENKVSAMAVGGGGGAAAHITASPRGGGSGGDGEGWDKHPGGSPPGGGDKHPGGIPRGAGMGQTPWRHPRGGGGVGTNTLVQPNYPTPTQSVNPAGARGRGARKGQQSRGTRWRG